MVKAKEKTIQKGNNLESKTIKELLEIYKTNKLKIERNENEIKELKKRFI